MSTLELMHEPAALSPSVMQSCLNGGAALAGRATQSAAKATLVIAITGTGRIVVIAGETYQFDEASQAVVGCASNAVVVGHPCDSF